MGEVAKALAQEGSFEWQGKTYRLAPLTYEAIALWEEYLAGRAWRELERARRHLSPQEYEAQARGFREDAVAGAFSFFSRASAQAQLSWEGLIEMAAVRVIVAQPDLDPAEARKLVRTIHEHDLEKWAELKRKMDEQDDDPNAPAPGTSPGTIPDVTTSTASAPGSFANRSP